MPETKQNGKKAAGTAAGLLAGIVAAIVGGTKSCAKEVRQHPGRFINPATYRGVKVIYESTQDRKKRSYLSTSPNGNVRKNWQYSRPYNFSASNNNSGSKEE